MPKSTFFAKDKKAIFLDRLVDENKNMSITIFDYLNKQSGKYKINVREAEEIIVLLKNTFKIKDNE